MKLRTVFHVASLTLAILLASALIMMADALAQEEHQLRPRIALKSEEVIRNDLEQLGLPGARVRLVGETAQVQLRVEGEPVLLEVDRQYGTIQILKASPRARRIIESRVPAIQLSPAPPLKEDCVAFNPGVARRARVRGRWKIIEGKHWLFDFENKGAEAARALKVIKHYKMTNSCFVGRPDPSFTYLLSSNRAPAGAMPGEDCISFDPDRTAVIQARGRWKIAEGSHWVFDFGTSKSEAETALAIIKRYGFTHSCFVGRPRPSFSYLRR